jgi:uncharacterized membrane protein YbhN (UPF0104 family)
LSKHLKGWLEAGVRRYPRFQPAGSHLTAFLIEGQNYARDFKRLALAVGLGIVFQVLGAISTLVLARAMGIGLPLADWCWITAVIALALLLPVTVGGLGLREGLYMGLLAAWGVAGETALALSLTGFALQALAGLPGCVLHLLLTLSRRRGGLPPTP